MRCKTFLQHIIFLIVISKFVLNIMPAKAKNEKFEPNWRLKSIDSLGKINSEKTEGAAI